jgi:hypothetical protein
MQSRSRPIDKTVNMCEAMAWPTKVLLGTLQSTLDASVVAVLGPMRVWPDETDGFPDMADVENLESILDLLREIFNILAVLGWK